MSLAFSKHLSEIVDSVDQDKWGKKVKISDPNDLTEKVISGYILHTKLWYEKGEYQDYYLWEAFREDFTNWTTEIFDIGDTKIRRDFRNFLVQHGVYIPRNGGKIAENLSHIVQDNNYYEWTNKEVADFMKTSKHLYSRFNPNIKTEPSSTDQAYLQNLHEVKSKRKESAAHSALQSQEPQRTPISSVANPDLISRNQIPLSQQPPPQRENQAAANRLLTDLMKVYQDDSKKYSGELYDILDTKVQNFYDCCHKLGLGADQYRNAYSIMLKGRASAFYYDRLSNQNYDFVTMIDLTKQHFETEENKQFYMSEWRETTFPRIISLNPTASRLECLQILFDKLQTIQRGLSQTYQTKYSLRDQVISACRGVEECNLALYSPVSTYEGVCYQLRSAVGTAMRSREAQQFSANMCFQDNTNIEYDQYWTDRTYGGRGISHGRRNFEPRGQRRNQNSEQNFTRERIANGNFSSRQKKCYVCSRHNCWLTKNTNEKRRAAFDKFRQYSQNTSMAYFQTFLVHFEGIEG